MKVVVVKYNAGNIASVANALNRLGVEPIISDDAETLRTSDKVIFPGVGEASSAMNYLRERGLDVVLKSLNQPVMGICLGMQLLCASSEENETECLGILPCRARKFPSGGLKVPHMGWNTVSNPQPPLFEGIASEEYFYFVHGYYVETGKQTIATCTYGETFSAAIHHANFYAVQFHPEKSGIAGQKIMENFLKL